MPGADFVDLDPGTCDLILCQEDFGTTGITSSGAVARHPAIGHALAAGIEAVNRGDLDMARLLPAPGCWTRSVALYLARRAGHQRLPATVISATVTSWPRPWPSIVPSYKHTRKHWSRTAFQHLKPPKAPEACARGANATE